MSDYSRRNDGLVRVLLAWMLAVRLLLTVALLILVFRETGPWTVVAFALVMVSAETQVRLMKGGAR